MATEIANFLRERRVSRERIRQEVKNTTEQLVRDGLVLLAEKGREASKKEQVFSWNADRYIEMDRPYLEYSADISTDVGSTTEIFLSVSMQEREKIKRLATKNLYQLDDDFEPKICPLEIKINVGNETVVNIDFHRGLLYGVKLLEERLYDRSVWRNDLSLELINFLNGISSLVKGQMTSQANL